jgi:DNA helicase-4
VNFLSIILVLVLGSIGAFFLRKALRLFRVQANERIQPILPRIIAANADMRYLLDLARGYFSHYDRTKWLEDYSDVLMSIRELGFLARLVKPEDRKAIVEFQGYHSDIDYNRSKFNSELMRQELDRYNEFFDDIEGRTLDRQQRETIITEEDNNLCIAGAGSGKTTTIVGKISYLLDRYKVDPKRILLISFTRKAADSLTNRVGVPNLKGYTFHKLGLDIISEVEGVKPAIFDEGQYRQFIEKKFQEYMSAPGTREAFLDFFENQLKPYRSQFEFDTRSQYIQYLKDHNFETYKNITDNQGRIITNQRERVKSIEESKIANWLLFNGFFYVYEKPYEIDTRDKEHGQYKPDFYVEQNGRKVYIEHFGVNREFKVPPFFADSFNGDYEKANRSYNSKIRWAREIHSKNNTDLIETYSYQMHDGALFEHLKRSLLALGFEIKPLSIDEKIEIIRRHASRELESIVELVSTFIVLMKSNNRSFEELEAKLDESKIPYVKDRGNGLFEADQMYLSAIPGVAGKQQRA